MAVVPGGWTCKLQPCDVSWDKPFKDKFRDFCDDWLIDGAVEETRGGNRKPPNKAQVMRWIKQTWVSVKVQLLQKASRNVAFHMTLMRMRTTWFSATQIQRTKMTFNNKDVTEGQAAVEIADLLRPVPAVILWAIAYDKPGSSQESDFGHDTDPNSPGC